MQRVLRFPTACSAEDLVSIIKHYSNSSSRERVYSTLDASIEEIIGTEESLEGTYTYLAHGHPKNEKKIIYIGSIYHSGSTPIDQMLSEYRGVFGIGELYKFFNDGPKVIAHADRFLMNVHFGLRSFTFQKNVKLQ